MIPPVWLFFWAAKAVFMIRSLVILVILPSTIKANHMIPRSDHSIDSCTHWFHFDGGSNRRREWEWLQKLKKDSKRQKYRALSKFFNAYISLINLIAWGQIEHQEVSKCCSGMLELTVGLAFLFRLFFLFHLY